MRRQRERGRKKITDHGLLLLRDGMENGVGLDCNKRNSEDNERITGCNEMGYGTVTGKLDTK